MVSIFSNEKAEGVFQPNHLRENPAGLGAHLGSSAPGGSQDRKLLSLLVGLMLWIEGVPELFTGLGELLWNNQGSSWDFRGPLGSSLSPGVSIPL